MCQGVSHPLLPIVDPHHDGPTSSIFKCTENGSPDLDFEQLQLHLDAQEHEDDETDDVVLSLLNDDDSDDEEEDEEQPTYRPLKKSRRARAAVTYTDADGNKMRFDCRTSLWYKNYVQHPSPEDKDFQKKFRTRFRLPHEQFTELSNDLEESEYFERWKDGKTDAAGFKAVPIPLLLLCGWTFDDLEENTGISREVNRVFFHRFI